LTGYCRYARGFGYSHIGFDTRSQKMSKLGIVLDIGKKMITIDQIELPMKPIESFKDVKNLNDFQRKHSEPTSTLDATKRVV